jgi:hypothetical protein
MGLSQAIGPAASKMKFVSKVVNSDLKIIILICYFYQLTLFGHFGQLQFF